MMTKLNTAFRIVDASYFLKFLLRLLALYALFRLINWGMIGIIVPGGGWYSPFIDHSLNYVTWLKVSVLQTASWLGRLAGIDSYLLDQSWLQITGSRKLFMAWSCTGLEIMSFWAAFAFADTTPWRRKIKWCLGGLFCIWAVNCLRVALLIIAIKKDWPQIGTIRHHDTFNVVAYGFVFMLMLLYYRNNKNQFAV